MVFNIIVDNIGESMIWLKIIGYEKIKVFVCLVVKGDGIKLKLFIVFFGVKRELKVLNDEFKIKCVVVFLINGWMNEELIVFWVKGVLG